MNDRQLRDHVLRLVRQVIAEKNLPSRSRAVDVIAALGFPPPTCIPLQDGADGARKGRQIFYSDRITCWERIEFTLFHELLHILIDEDGEVVSQLHEHFYHGRDAERKQVLENLCNVGAAEFVMPAEEFTETMRVGEWRLAAIAAAVQRFEASALACGFQFAYHNPDRCILVVCEHGMLHRSEYEPAILEGVPNGPCLHVAYTAYNPNEEYQMCRFVPVSSDHPIHHAWRNGTNMDGEAPGFFTNPKTRKWLIRCEIVCIGSRAFAAYYPKGRAYQASQGSLFD